MCGIPRQRVANALGGIDSNTPSLDFIVDELSEMLRRCVHVSSAG